MCARMQPAAWVLAALLLLTATAWTQAGEDLGLAWSTIDGGGAMWAGNGDLLLRGTVGQFDASPTSCTGGDFQLVGGFWAIVTSMYAAADFNQDGYVDRADYDLFQACATGAAIAYRPAALPPDCTLAADQYNHIAADFDADGDVDQDDFAQFQRCISEFDIPADPNCTH